MRIVRLFLRVCIYISPVSVLSNFFPFKIILHFSITVIAYEEPKDPCFPSPCGPNSQCHRTENQAVCSCLPSYLGSPPNCKPECVVSSECPSHKACSNQKCVDPCPGTCGSNADCKVINHSPVCSCPSGYTGDPFTRCYAIPRKRIELL